MNNYRNNININIRKSFEIKTISLSYNVTTKHKVGADMIDNFDIKSRCELLAEYMIEHNATVRSCAAAFGISKSTVHKDITEKLKNTNYTLYSRIKILLEQNKAERHLRGGEATRLKFHQKKQEKAV